MSGKWMSQDPRTSEWIAYAKADNDKLEREWNGRKNDVKLTIAGNTFTVNLKKMTQSNSGGGSRSVKREAPSGPQGRAPPPKASSASASALDSYWTGKFKDADEIDVSNFQTLFEPMAIDMATVEPYVFMFKMHAVGCFVLQKDEFLNGMAHEGLTPDKTVKQKVAKWIQTLQSSDDEFSDFWEFCFKFSRNSASAKVLPMEDAIEPIKVILGIRSRYTYTKVSTFLDYLTAKVKTISFDLWKQILKFLQTIKPDCTNYDEDACWNTAIDDYVETVKK